MMMMKEKIFALIAFTLLGSPPLALALLKGSAGRKMGTIFSSQPLKKIDISRFFSYYAINQVLALSFGTGTLYIPEEVGWTTKVEDLHLKVV